jgi:hypothetical protein
MGQRGLAVERHDVVEVVAGVPILAVGVVSKPLSAELAEATGRASGMRPERSRPYKRGRLVGVLEDDELVGRASGWPACRRHRTGQRMASM